MEAPEVDAQSHPSAEPQLFDDLEIDKPTSESRFADVADFARQPGSKYLTEAGNPLKVVPWDTGPYDSEALH